MHINQIEGAEFVLTKNTIIGIKNYEVDSIGGVCKARDLQRKNRGVENV